MARAAGRPDQPVIIRAYYSAGAHHPHLQAGTTGDWPLNVFDEKQAAELPTLRAMASADLHNLVFRADYRIVPAVTACPATPRGRGSEAAS